MVKIPLCRPETGPDELNAIKEVLDSGWLAHGPKVKQFEEDFASYIGVKYAVSVNSCASALQAAIMATGAKGEIIVPSFTFPASANSIVNAGCKPVFCEIRKDTLNIDIDDVKKKLTKNTIGIMPVHYAGQPCEMDEIVKICNDKKLFLIEDSAETIGGTYKGKKTGNFGIGCFSFYPTKNITTGEGGMVTTDNPDIAESVRTIRGHGITKGAYEREAQAKPWIRVSILPGYNFRMNEISAAMGIVQLKKMDSMNIRRREHAKYLSSKLSKFKEITLPIEAKDAYHTYQMYIIRLDESVDRDGFVIYLRNNNVEASVHFYPPVHLHDYYMEQYGYKAGDLPITEKISSKVVTLPMFPSLTKEEMEVMAKTIGEAIVSCRKK
jgi:perosamine synthetase